MSEQPQQEIEIPNVRQLAQTLETNGLIVQHKLQSAVELVLGGCIDWNPGGGKPPTYDFSNDDEELIESLARAYYLVAAAEAARLNSYKPPVNNFFMPEKQDRQATVTPFPFNTTP